MMVMIIVHLFPEGPHQHKGQHLQAYKVPHLYLSTNCYQNLFQEFLCIYLLMFVVFRQPGLHLRKQNISFPDFHRVTWLGFFRYCLVKKKLKERMKRDFSLFLCVFVWHIYINIKIHTSWMDVKSNNAWSF